MEPSGVEKLILFSELVICEGGGRRFGGGEEDWVVFVGEVEEFVI